MIVHLTATEFRVLKALMIDGADNETIARRVGGIGLQTVKTHMRRIYKKTGLHWRAELVLAVERGDVRPVIR